MFIIMMFYVVGQGGVASDEFLCVFHGFGCFFVSGRRPWEKEQLSFDLRAGRASVGYCMVTQAGSRPPAHTTAGQRQRAGGGCRISVLGFCLTPGGS